MVKLEKETPRQRQFREDMEDAGIEIRLYSGRGMYGTQTYGVNCGRGEDEVSEADVYRATELTLKQDSMGLGTILYL